MVHNCVQCFQHLAVFTLWLFWTNYEIYPMQARLLYKQRTTRLENSQKETHTQRERESLVLHMFSITAFLPPQRRRGSHFLCALLQWSSMNRCFNVFIHLFIQRFLFWTNVSFSVLFLNKVTSSRHNTNSCLDFFIQLRRRFSYLKKI